MIEKKDVGYLGIIGILSVIIGSIFLSSDEFANSYVCSITEEVGVFYGGISSTGYTAYPNKENRKGYERCGDLSNKGTWVKLEDYAKQKGLDPLSFLVNQKSEKNSISSGKEWLCSPEKCVEKK